MHAFGQRMTFYLLRVTNRDLLLAFTPVTRPVYWCWRASVLSAYSGNYWLHVRVGYCPWLCGTTSRTACRVRAERIVWHRADIPSASCDFIRQEPVTID